MIQKIGCILSGASRDTYTPHQRCKLLLFIDVHWAHNPKVVGSNPTPATNRKGHPMGGLFLLYGDWNHVRMVRLRQLKPVALGGGTWKERVPP